MLQYPSPPTPEDFLAHLERHPNTFDGDTDDDPGIVYFRKCMEVQAARLAAGLPQHEAGEES
jgi:hypothetical protein